MVLRRSKQMSARRNPEIVLSIVACLALFLLPQAQNLVPRLKPTPGEGQRVCVAVGEKKVAQKFAVRIPPRVDIDPPDTAKVWPEVGPEGSDTILRVQGLKPGKVIAHVYSFRGELRRDAEGRLKASDRVDAWF